MSAPEKIDLNRTSVPSKMTANDANKGNFRGRSATLNSVPSKTTQVGQTQLRPLSPTQLNRPPIKISDTKAAPPAPPIFLKKLESAVPLKQAFSMPIKRSYTAPISPVPTSPTSNSDKGKTEMKSEITPIKRSQTFSTPKKDPSRIERVSLRHQAIQFVKENGNIQQLLKDFKETLQGTNSLKDQITLFSNFEAALEEKRKMPVTGFKQVKYFLGRGSVNVAEKNFSKEVDSLIKRLKELKVKDQLEFLQTLSPQIKIQFILSLPPETVPQYDSIFEGKLHQYIALFEKEEPGFFETALPYFTLTDQLLIDLAQAPEEQLHLVAHALVNMTKDDTALLKVVSFFQHHKESETRLLLFGALYFSLCPLSLKPYWEKIPPKIILAALLAMPLEKISEQLAKDESAIPLIAINTYLRYLLWHKDADELWKALDAFPPVIKAAFFRSCTASIIDFKKK